MIYLDHAATTSLAPEVLQAMLPWMGCEPGNPSSIHAAGRAARHAVDFARQQVADAIGAHPYEIYFTSGGTESDNWAIKGTALRHRGGRIVTSAIEHHAVLNSCAWLEKRGYALTLLPVGASGQVSPAAAEEAVTDDTILLSVMAANNETGALQPSAALGQVAKAHCVPYHIDAVQAFGAVPIRVDSWQADLLSLSAHKFHGPKGIGALYIREGVRLEGCAHGGAQERGRRAGTENVPAIVGMGAAAELAVRSMESRIRRQSALRARLAGGLAAGIPGLRINGHPTEHLPGHLNITIPGIVHDALLLRLDLAGICASGGAACTAGSPEPSHVLLAMGLSVEEAGSSIRFSISEENTENDIDEAIRAASAIAAELRQP